VERWLSRWAPLSGAVAGILVAVAIFSGSNTPNNNAPVGQVARFYLQHATGQKASAIAGILGVAFLVLFAVAMASRVRAGASGGWLANGAIGGAALAAAGFATLLAFTWVLASDIKFVTASTVQTLNVLQNDLFLPAIAGFFVFGVVGGLAAVVSKAPARWMGWVLFGFGIAMVVPPISWFAILGTFLWVLVAGIWLAVQGTPQVRQTSDPEVSLARV
jgi:predicted histidine transporter YuiF (NhaC family)